MWIHPFIDRNQHLRCFEILLCLYLININLFHILNLGENPYYVSPKNVDLCLYRDESSFKQRLLGKPLSKAFESIALSDWSTRYAVYLCGLEAAVSRNLKSETILRFTALLCS